MTVATWLSKVNDNSKKDYDKQIKDYIENHLNLKDCCRQLQAKSPKNFHYNLVSSYLTPHQKINYHYIF